MVAEDTEAEAQEASSNVDSGGGVFIGVITAGDVRVETCRSLLTAAVTEGTPVTHTYLLTYGPYLDDARNRVVEKFLTSPCDLLLFVDSDIEFTIEDIRLVADATSPTTPVVGGVYYSPKRPGSRSPVVYTLVPDMDAHYGQAVFTQLTAEQVDAYASQPFPADAIGTGFMCIHRSLLDKMLVEFGNPTPWFAEEIVNGVHVGEDMMFCLRADSLGFPPLAHPGVSISHYKIARY